MENGGKCHASGSQPCYAQAREAGRIGDCDLAGGCQPETGDSTNNYAYQVHSTGPAMHLDMVSPNS